VIKPLGGFVFMLAIKNSKEILVQFTFLKTERFSLLLKNNVLKLKKDE
jgi:hypothetical protein